MPGKRGKVTSNHKDRTTRNSKLSASQVKEVVKPKLQFGAGWSIDNLVYLQTTPPEKLIDELYKIFGIPLLYKDQENRLIVHLYIEFQAAAFQFAQQLNDPAKELVVLAVFGDYLSNVPSFTNSGESFDKWADKAISIISKNESFNQQEIAAITTYITQNIHAKSHIYYYILTDEAIQNLDSEGMSLFHQLIKEDAETSETDQQQQPAKNDLEEQLAAAAQAEKNKEEALEKEKLIAKELENIIQENFANIQAALDKRNENIIMSIGSTEDKLDAIAKGKKV